MNDSSLATDRSMYLEERVRYLEEANYNFVALLELLASSDDFQSELVCGNSSKAIFQATLVQLKRLLPFVTFNILECRDDSSFELVISEPTSRHDEQRAIIDQLIMSGSFAWALSRNQAIIVPSPIGSYSCLLHTIATSKRIRGMFFGLLDRDRKTLDSPTLNALTSVLRSTAHALESSVLYGMLRMNLQNVEQIVQERTTELREAKKRAEEMAAELQKSNERLEVLCYTDPLTSLYNRRFFMKDLERELARAKRKNRPLSLLVLDIDCFKEVNDTYGHQYGDLVIKAVADVCRNMMRHCDMVARYGGEEFVVVLPETPLSEGGIIAERLRQEVTALCFSAPMENLKITISVGVACFLADGEESVDSLFQRADEALLLAKRQGRNRVEITPDHVPTGS